MKKSIHILYIILFSEVSTYSQNFQWAKGFSSNDNAIGLSICMDDAGYVYSVGTYVNYSTLDIGGVVLTGGNGYISKHDSLGNLVWAKSYQSEIRSIYFYDGNLYIGGSIPVSSDYAAYFAKVDTSGNIIWSRTSTTVSSNVRWVNCISVDNMGNIYISGSYSGSISFGSVSLPTVSSGSKLFFVKYDASGAPIWGVQAGGTISIVNDMTIDSNGNVFLIGEFSGTATFGAYSITQYSGDSTYDSYLAKYDGTGTCSWVKAFKGSGRQFAPRSSVDASDNVYFVGFTTGGGDVNISGVVLPYDSNKVSFYGKYLNDGTLSWVKQIGGQAGAIHINPPDSVYIGGSMYQYGFFDDITLDTKIYSKKSFIAKTNTGGEFSWVYNSQATGNTYTNTNSRLLRDIVSTSTGDVFGTGFFVDTTYFDSLYRIITPYASNANPFVFKLNDFIQQFKSSNASLCPDSNFYVTYKPGTTFNGGNSFTLQLSDENGDFTNAINLSFTLSATNDTLYSQIPDPITPSNNYKVRMLSSSPHAISLALNLIINDVPIAEITYSGATSFCLGQTLQLNALNKPGFTYQWKRNGTNISGATNTSYTVNQSGDYTVAVSTVCETVVSDPVSITVHPLPTVTLSNFPVACTNGGLYQFVEGSPSGGTYSGNGVSNGYFDPTAVTLGNQTITYTYTDGNGCTNSASKSIKVENPPAVNLSIPAETCIEDGAITLNGGLPTGGTYFGNGVSGSTFDPTVAGLGFHTINYTYTNSSACSDTASLDIEVISCPLGTASYKTSSVHLYPNPTSGIIMIEGLQQNKVESISVLDITGRLLIQTTFTNTINISSFDNGTYIILISTDNENIRQKILLVRD